MGKYLAVLMLFAVQMVFGQERELLIEKKYNGVKRTLVGTSGGNISVTGSDVAETMVKVHVRPSNYQENVSEAELRSRLERDHELKMEMVGDQLQLSAKPRKNIDWKRGVSVSFELIVPKNTMNDLATSGGNIVLRSVQGTQKFATSGGNLVVEHVRGKVSGQTSGGNIIAEDIADDINLATSGGNIKAEGGKGKITLITSGGNVMLKDMSGEINGSTSGGNVIAENLGGAIKASTSGGNVIMEKINGSLVAATNGGSLKVQMTGVDKEVRLSNPGGRVDITLPAGKGYDLDLRGSRITAPALNGFSGTVTEERIDGKLKGGGVLVKVVNGGDIQLKFQ